MHIQKPKLSPGAVGGYYFLFIFGLFVIFVNKNNAEFSYQAFNSYWYQAEY